MCQFRNISDSATRSASCLQSFGIRFCCGKIKILIRNSGRTIPTLTVLLHIFLGFSAETENEDVPIQEYFGFIHALHLLPVVFIISFLLQIIHNPLALQAAHTYAPYKNCRQLLSDAILSAVFCVHVPDIIRNLTTNIIPSGIRCRSSFIFLNGQPTMSEQRPW